MGFHRKLAPLGIALVLVAGGCSSARVASPGAPNGHPSALPTSAGHSGGKSSARTNGHSSTRSTPDRTSPSKPSGSTRPAGPKPHTTKAVQADADENAQPTKSGKQEAVMKRVPGKASSTCVVVGQDRDVRSGGFVAGPFDTANASYGHSQPGHSKRTVRLYFVPQHAGKMPGLALRFSNEKSDLIVTAHQKLVGDAEQWKFYDTYTRLGTGGTWTVRAVAGPDKGCFTFELPKRG